jgi:hypothetical protein
MKTVLFFECEICGMKYSSETQCIECEKSHIGVKGIKSVGYVARCSLPKSIEVWLEDGRSETYKR